ncbi:MAG: hypothetical protein J7J44_03405 [Deltaproteobacteria bacterium]|nr:hypothetical protein [Deltaproteobacteria bacterium]
MKRREEYLANLCYEYGIDILYAFGSRAKEVKIWLKEDLRDLPPSLSDIDIAIKPISGKYLDIKEKVQLTIALEDFFKVPRADLVVIPEADPFLAANIIRGERLFCRDPYRADNYELYILRRAGDLAPLERERLALIMEGK